MTVKQRFVLAAFIVGSLLLIDLLKPVLTPFLVAAFFAYLGDPLVQRLMTLKLPRTLAATIVFVAIMLLLCTALFFLIPLLSRQITLLINRLPEVISWAQQFALPWINEHFHANLSFDVEDLKLVIRQHWQQAGTVAASVWKVFSHSGLALAGWFANLLLIPVVMFYLLRDWDLVLKEISELIPRKVEPTIAKIARECNEVLGAFIRGQLLVMLGLAIYYVIGLSLVGLDLALLIGSIIGVLAIVPYLGFIVGILLASIATFMQFHDWMHLVYIAIVFGVGNAVENMILTPWLVGDRIGLHPVAVIFAILAGGYLFGFVGVLLALPVAAVLMVLLRHMKKQYLVSEYYK